ncbi:MAG: EamA family transporter [Candidatus Latescibacteria bacterium]|nr:EamA family transporter [bacterium]MBD3423921.1 EamA family transporter [Candidatus Latescibacterota bacterium]
MIWLLPAAGCSIAVALILKISEEARGNRLLLIGVNYTVASVLAFLLTGGDIYWPGWKGFTLGASAGVDFVLGFLLMLSGMSMGPLAVPVTVMRLSVAVPIVASIMIWGERPGLYPAIGIVLGIFAIILFGSGLSDGRSRETTTGRYWFVIVSLFLVMGAGDLLLKTYREVIPGMDRIFFTFILFTTAAVMVWILVLKNGVSFNIKTFLLGALLGVPNLYSTIFMLKALETVPASRAFPFVNLTVIFASTLIGFAIWKERLGSVALIGLVLAAIAIVLLPL